MPALPLRPQDKIDIVPANYVGKAIVTIHQKEPPAHGIYHLSSGTGSQTYQELTDAIAHVGAMLRPIYFPFLGGLFSATVTWVANPTALLGSGVSRWKSFGPFPDGNTVFDNS